MDLTAVIDEWENSISLSNPVQIASILYLKNSVDSVGGVVDDSLELAGEAPLQSQTGSPATIPDVPAHSQPVPDRIEDLMDKDQNEIYLVALLKRQEYLDRFLAVKSQLLEPVLGALSQLVLYHSQVQRQTSSLQLECETLLNNQQLLGQRSDYMSEILRIFSTLDTVNKLLFVGQDTSEILAINDSFLPSLHQIDHCIQFLKQHNYRDSELYLMRFKQCLSRAMSCIKLHLSSVLAGFLASTSSKSDIEFKSLSYQLQPLLAEIEYRSADYLGLLNDCHSIYFNARHQLYDGYFQSLALGIKGPGLIVLQGMNACQELVVALFKEYQMFYSFFGKGGQGADMKVDKLSVDPDVCNFLESLALPVYEALRPLVLAESSLVTLSEFCLKLTDLKSTLVDDRAPLQVLLDKIIQDCQSRLVFRCQTFIRAELQGFVPVPEMHLNYPKLLQSTLDDSTPKIKVSSTSYIAYPTVERLDYLANLLHGSIKDEIFVDIFQECFCLALDSVRLASSKIKQKYPLDGTLFFVRQLIYLRYLISRYDGAGSKGTLSAVKERHLDFSPLLDGLNNIFKISFFSIIQHGFPKVVTTESLNYKQECDFELKQLCEQLILAISKQVIEPLAPFVLKASNPNMRKQLSDASADTIEMANEVHREFIKCVDMRFKFNIAKISEYLPAYDGIRHLILAPVKSNVRNAYTQFLDICQQEPYLADALELFTSKDHLDAMLNAEESAEAVAPPLAQEDLKQPANE